MNALPQHTPGRTPDPDTEHALDVLGAGEAETSLIDGLLEEIGLETVEACYKHPPYHSMHEALGIIEEELDEFRRVVYKKHSERDYGAARQELLQLGCTVVRTLMDVVDPQWKKE